MKKILGILAFAMLLNGCDDGEIEVQTLNFDDATTQSCGNIIYKLNDTEALFFEIPYETSFVNDATLPNTPRVVQIDGTANKRIIFRAYNGTVATANICETVQPGTPQIIDEWNAVSGSVEVTTVPIIVANTDPDFPGGEKIIRYRHTIVFRNVEYENGQVDSNFEFGSFEPTATALPFNFDQEVDKCSTSNLIYNFNGSEAITLNIDPSLIVNENTPVGTPRTGTISATQNVVTYKTFGGQITAPYFCASTVPATPAVIQQWDAIEGTVEVITTTGGGSTYSHEIRLKNVKLKKGNTTFLLSTNYLLGNLITS